MGGLAGAVVLALAALSACAPCARAQDARFPSGFLSVLPVLRPPKAVLRALRAAEPNLFMELPERLAKWGYPLEQHTVRTEDGFLLTVHRIPRGRSGAGAESNAVGGPGPDAAAAAAARPPVILQHGMLACSEYWTVAGPGVAPALRLADEGYDVWITNARGSHFSKKHETLGRRDPKMWRFSWHEMGMYDTPAVIDHILNVTKQEKLYFMSHSMGNTMFYVTMSMKPEYNAKIRLQVALSPAVFFDDGMSELARILVANADYLKAIFDGMPTYEILPRADSSLAFAYLLCGDKAYFNKLCAVMFSLIVGAVDLNNTTNLYNAFTRAGSSTSAIVLWHFSQLLRSGLFRPMDYGVAENMRKYGTREPPEYPLEKVTAPVAIYASEADILVPAKGVKRLAKALPNVVSLYIVNETFFNHVDFSMHPHLNELLLDHALETMKRF